MDAPALFSVIQLNSADQELPDPTNGPYFVATKDGYMACQNTHWGRVLVPVKEAPSLATTTSLLWHDIDLPAEIISQAWGFFRKIFEIQKTEAMVDITWSAKHGYRLFVPPQNTSHGGVNAKRTPEHYRGRIVGTIHSHCDFNSYHSGTDTHDADGHDGLHMTIGHVHEDKLDIAILISANGIRWDDMKITDVVKDPSQIKPLEPPAWWLPLVDPKPPVTVTSSITTYKPQHKPEQNQKTIVTHHGTQISRWIPPCVHGRRLEESCPGCGRFPAPQEQTVIGFREQNADEPPLHETSLDALIRQLHFTDPRIEALGEIQDRIDAITQDLEDLGIDFDYEVEEAFTFDEAQRLNEYFRRLEEQQ